jgi:hypothetical protein
LSGSCLLYVFERTVASNDLALPRAENHFEVIIFTGSEAAESVGVGAPLVEDLGPACVTREDGAGDANMATVVLAGHVPAVEAGQLCLKVERSVEHRLDHNINC